MTAILSTPVRSKDSTPSPSLRPASPTAAGSAEAEERREQLRRSIRAHEARARQAAEQGDLAEAARLILAALDGERRMASTGPQVLQVIKPRG